MIAYWVRRVSLPSPSIRDNPEDRLCITSLWHTLTSICGLGVIFGLFTSESDLSSHMHRPATPPYSFGTLLRFGLLSGLFLESTAHWFSKGSGHLRRVLTEEDTFGEFDCWAVTSTSFTQTECGRVDYLLEVLGVEGAAAHLNAIMPSRLAGQLPDSLSNYTSFMSLGCKSLHAGTQPNTTCAGLWDAMDACIAWSHGEPPYKLMGQTFYSPTIHPVEKFYLVLQYFHYQSKMDYEYILPVLFDICSPDVLATLVDVPYHSVVKQGDEWQSRFNHSFVTYQNQTDRVLVAHQDQLNTHTLTLTTTEQLRDAQWSLTQVMFGHVWGNMSIHHNETGDHFAHVRQGISGNTEAIVRVNNSLMHYQNQTGDHFAAVWIAFAQGDERQSQFNNSFIRYQNQTDRVLVAHQDQLNTHTLTLTTTEQLRDAQWSLTQVMFGDVWGNMSVYQNETGDHFAHVRQGISGNTESIVRVNNSLMHYQNQTGDNFAAVWIAFSKGDAWQSRFNHSFIAYQNQTDRMLHKHDAHLESVSFEIAGLSYQVDALENNIIATLSVLLKNSSAAQEVVTVLFSTFRTEFQNKLWFLGNHTQTSVDDLANADEVLQNQIDDLVSEDTQIYTHINDTVAVLKEQLITQLADALQESAAAGDILNALFSRFQADVADHMQNMTRVFDARMQTLESIHTTDVARLDQDILTVQKLAYSLGNQTFYILYQLNETVLAYQKNATDTFALFQNLFEMFQTDVSQHFLALIEHYNNSLSVLGDRIVSEDALLKTAMLLGFQDARDTTSRIERESKERDAILQDEITQLGISQNKTRDTLQNDMVQRDAAVNAKAESDVADLRTELYKEIQKIKPGSQNSTTKYLIPEASVTETVTSQINSIAALQDPLWITLQYWWDFAGFIISASTGAYWVLNTLLIVGGLSFVESVRYRWYLPERERLDNERVGFVGPVGVHFSNFVSHIEFLILASIATEEEKVAHTKDLLHIIDVKSNPLKLFSNSAELCAWRKSLETLQPRILKSIEINHQVKYKHTWDFAKRLHAAYLVWRKPSEIRILITELFLFASQENELFSYIARLNKPEKWLSRSDDRDRIEQGVEYIYKTLLKKHGLEQKDLPTILTQKQLFWPKERIKSRFFSEMYEGKHVEFSGYYHRIHRRLLLLSFLPTMIADLYALLPTKKEDSLRSVESISDITDSDSSEKKAQFDMLDELATYAPYASYGVNWIDLKNVLMTITISTMGFYNLGKEIDAFALKGIYGRGVRGYRALQKYTESFVSGEDQEESPEDALITRLADLMESVYAAIHQMMPFALLWMAQYSRISINVSEPLRRIMVELDTQIKNTYEDQSLFVRVFNRGLSTLSTNNSILALIDFMNIEATLANIKIDLVDESCSLDAEKDRGHRAAVVSLEEDKRRESGAIIRTRKKRVYPDEKSAYPTKTDPIQETSHITHLETREGNISLPSDTSSASQEKNSKTSNDTVVPTYKQEGRARHDTDPLYALSNTPHAQPKDDLILEKSQSDSEVDSAFQDIMCFSETESEMDRIFEKQLQIEKELGLLQNHTVNPGREALLQQIRTPIDDRANLIAQYRETYMNPEMYAPAALEQNAKLLELTCQLVNYDEAFFAYYCISPISTLDDAKDD